MSKDKYKYLEKINDKSVIDFYENENKRTLSYLKSKNYKLIKKSISKALCISWRTIPVIKGKYKFWIEYSYKDKYSKLYSQYKENQPKMILDFNLLNNEEFYKYNPSESGELIVVLTDKQGLETYYYNLINANGEKIKDSIDNICEFLCWDRDSGFYYIKKIYIDGDIRDYSSYKYEIYYHKIGDIQSKDKKFLNSDEIEFDNDPFISLEISKDNKYIIVQTSNYYDKFIIIKNNISGKILKVYRYKDCNMYAEIINDKLLIYTNEKNEFGEIIEVDMKDIEKNLEEKVLIKPKHYLLDDYIFTKDYIYCVYLKDVAHFIKIYDYKGNFIRNIKFNIKGTISLTCDYIDNNVYIYFSSFTFPHTIYKYIFDKDKLEEIYQSKVKKEFSPENYNLEYKLVRSKDGTEIPFTMVYNKNNKLDKPSPALLYGYGGFGISNLPYYRPEILPFINNGGIYIAANIRGGKEFGRSWYYSAKGAKNKIKTIQDFISISEYLIENKYTNNNKLFINGMSHGGFIVSAAMFMRPDLYKGVIAEVPIVDFLIYKKYGSGSLLVNEYGDPDNKEDLKYILNWSPYQNLKKGIRYPDILITGATNDTRVGLAQPLKFAKKMQDYSLGKTYLYIDTDSGHMGNLDIDFQIEKNTLIFSFIYTSNC